MARLNYGNYRKAVNGFTLVELLLSVAVIAIVSTLAIWMLTGVKPSASELKLRSDVDTLNRAVRVYVGSGGNLDGVTDPRQVVESLKTVSTKDEQRTIPGLSGRMIDPGLTPVIVDGRNVPRLVAVWNSATKQFQVVESESAGSIEHLIRLFDTIETAPSEPVEETRQVAVNYNHDNGWVWAYQDRDAAAAGGPTEIPVGSAIGSGGPGPINPSAPGVLLPPTFSMDGGEFSYMPGLYTTLSNPNPSGSSRVYYRVGETGPWFEYTGEKFYLRPGVTAIYAYAATLDPDSFNNSPTANEIYDMDSLIFSGAAGGIFENAVGPRRRVYSIDNGDDQSSVVWGTPAQQFGLGSSMVFEGASFSDIAEGEEFTLGTLSYFNGTINTGSELDSIDLTLDLTLDVPELSSDVAFSLGLINTVNEIFNTADQNADYVQLESVVSTLDTVYLGETYYLQIRFGSVASNGFSTIDQFHVHEGATASGSLIGVITRTPWTPE